MVCNVGISSERFHKAACKSLSDTRYYITSVKKSSEQINQIVRKHWTVEKNLTWSLDVLFKEDYSLKKEWELCD